MYRFSSQSLDQVVNDAGAGGKEGNQHTGNNNYGYEVGQIHDGLDASLHEIVFYRIDHQRKDNRQGKPHEKIIDIDRNGIVNKTPEINRVEKVPDVPQSGPWTSPYSLVWIIVLERNQQSVQGHISKNEEINNCGQKQEIQIF